MKDEIKVLHVFGQMNRGGAESLIMNVMRNLKNNKIKFYFFVTTPKVGHFDKEIKMLGGQIIYIKSLTKDVRFSKEFKKMLEQLNPDVIHSHLHAFSGLILKNAAECNIPIRVAHSHTINGNQKEKFIRKVYNLYMKNLILKNATHLIGCSQEACQALFGDGKSTIIHNSIDLNQFINPRILPKDKLKRELNLPSQSIIVGHVGNFTLPKNHEKVINVFKEFRDREKDAHLVLIGEGTLRKEIEKLIEKSNLEKNVHLLGVRSDVPSLMKQLDLFLFPSLFEGLGLVLVEAQAAGIHIIASDSVPREADLGLNMIKFLPLSQNDYYWAKKMQESLKATNVNWYERKKTITLKRYNIESTVSDLEKIYVETKVNVTL